MREHPAPGWRPLATAGSTRSARALPALDPSRVPIDERGVAHRLAFVGEYARLLAFYGLDGEPRSDWTPFLRADASFLMAEMCTAYSVAEYFAAVALERRLRAAGGDRALEREVVAHIHRLAARINGWYQRAGQTVQAARGDRSLQDTLATVIKDDLSKYWFAVFDDDAWRRYWDDCQPGAFDANVWEEDQGGMPEEPRAERLITILNAFHRATKKLAELTAAPLEASFGQSDHPPHSALWIGFARLMEDARADLNRFTERHLDYYYRTVLKLRERDGIADATQVCFELAPPARELLLGAGTRLRAGQDASGQDIVFATQDDLAINAARVVALKTLSVAQSSVDEANPGRHVTGIVARPVANSEDGHGKPLVQPTAGWATFGGAPVAGAGLDAEVGVAIASPLLLLTAGEREVAITFRCAAAPQGGSAFSQVLSAYLDAVDRSRVRTGASPAQAPDELPADTCLLYVSGAKGWTAVPSFQLRHDSGAATITLQFRLRTTDPPILPAAQPELVGGLASPWPQVKVVLNPQARAYAYTFFQQLVLDALDIRVKATGLRDLAINTATGPVKSGQPFPVFGVVPFQGAAVQVTHAELSAKPLEYVALSIDWIGVPKNLPDYYRAYGRNIDDRTFQGKLFLHSDGRILEEQFALFAEGVRVSATLDMRRDGREIGAAENAVDARFATLRDTVPAGALRLELVEPDFAFGHDLYPQVVTEAALARTSTVLREVMREGRPGGAGKGEESLPEKITDFVKVSLDLADWALPRGGQEQGAEAKPQTGGEAGAGEGGKPTPSGGVAFPNPPFAPFAKGMSIDYVASASVRLDVPAGEASAGSASIELFDLDTFGYRRRLGGERALFPAFDAEGYLHIGIADLAPAQEITLLFHLRETAAFQRLVASQVDIEQALGGVQWHYLAKDQWRKIPSEALIADSTRGLTCSGIVKLLIPADATDTNTLLPGKLLWLQASVKSRADSYPNIVGIYPQAVAVRRVSPMPAEATDGSLPAGAIKELVDKSAAVKGVQQPMATVGGRPRDAVDQFCARVSERLRHKQRAIQPFDYERLVLDAFPQIAQARCLTCNTTRAYGATAVAPGNVVVAVVAARDEHAPSVEPRVPYETLSAIRDDLKGLASPSVRDIIVVNPLYERVTVNADVRFVPGREPGAAMLRLKADLARHLAPWRVQTDLPMPLGTGLGPLRRLVHFMEDLEDVAQVRVNAVVVTHDDGSTTRFTGDAEVRGSTPWSVLVPADEPELDIILGDDQAASPAPPAAPEVPEGAMPEEEVRQYFLVIPVERFRGASSGSEGREGGGG